MNSARIRKAFLYNEGAAQILDINEIKEYLKEKLGKIEVELRENFFSFCLLQDDLLYYSKKFASIKIQSIDQKISSLQEPFLAEIEYEKRRILGETKAFGILYDGLELQRIFF